MNSKIVHTLLIVQNVIFVSKEENSLNNKIVIKIQNERKNIIEY